MKKMGLISYILLIVMNVCVFGADDISAFKDQKRSLILWDKIKTSDWTDFELWKKEIYIKENNPNWHQFLKERRLSEVMGRVLQCVGNCYVESNMGNSKAYFRSHIKELEDFKTDESSYAWIFLLDGSLLRLSPSTSISFKEINIGETENFFHIRINYGNALWLDRSSGVYKLSRERETDVLFLPLDYYPANPKNILIDVDERNLFEYLEKNKEQPDQFKRLNELIVENNKIIKNKPTKVFFVMPNGSIVAKNSNIEFVVLVGGNGYFKVRDYTLLGLKEEISDASVTVYFRGYENTQSYLPDVNTWYALSDDGRNIEELSSNEAQQFAMGEFVTKRIPSILLGRELLIKKYPKFMFEEISRMELAQNHGYRKWVKYKGKELSEIDERIEFLKEYVRRVETTNLLSRKKIKNQFTVNHDHQIGTTYNSNFYSRAIRAYLRRGDMYSSEMNDYRQLNSTNRQLWKMMHAIR